MRKPFEFASHAQHRPTLPVLVRQAQLGTHVYLGLTSSRRLFDSEVDECNLGRRSLIAKLPL
jgi:hypothetical protein